MNILSVMNNMEKNVVILDIDYVTYEDKPVIRLFSKEGDKNIILLDDTFEPYLYVVQMISTVA